MPFDSTNYKPLDSEAVTVLLAARALIEREANWTKGPFAADATGRDVDPLSQEACMFCVAGALKRAGENADFMAGYDAREAIRDAVPAVFERMHVMFNEDQHTTHADVLALFDRAIAAAEPTP